MSDATYRLDLSTVRPLAATLKATPVSEAPEALYQQLMEAQESMLRLDYSKMPETSNNPTYAGYANVVVNGKIVAELDNHGFVTTSNRMAGRVSSAAESADATAGVVSGPLLAQARAEKIAEALGGSVVKLSSAMSQSAFDVIPQPKAVLDVSAMMQDARYAQLEEIRQARTAFLAQQLAQD